MQITKDNIVELMEKAIKNYEKKNMLADVLFWNQIKGAVESLVILANNR